MKILSIMVPHIMHLSRPCLHEKTLNHVGIRLISRGHQGRATLFPHKSFSKLFQLVEVQGLSLAKFTFCELRFFT